MPKLRIFTDAGFSKVHADYFRASIGDNELIVPSTTGSVLAASEHDPLLERSHIIFGQPSPESILSASQLRWVQLTSAGFTRYDTPDFRAAIASRGIVMTNASDVYVEACVEHVFAFMLAQARLLPASLEMKMKIKGGTEDWRKFRHGHKLLTGQSVVILGYGVIAARLVEVLAPFKMKITAMRRHACGDETVPVIMREELPEALADADHVISLLPDNAESLRFISAERLAAMKPGAIFYNIGRGTTVDQDALTEALHSGHLGAAWLDVTDPEPLPHDHPLNHAPRCHITPHVGGGHHNEARTLIDHFVANLRRFEAGSPLLNRII